MQGFNMGRYIPPASQDASLSAKATGGFNEDSREKRGPGGAQTVRFEMPFATWCTTCQPEAIIGQGIRFNAEKKKVGNYYSTPIWSFRMKHTACGGIIEIRTDPEKREYIVTEGGRRRETGATVSTEGAFGEILTEEERERRRNDAFAQLEGKKTEGKVARDENDRVEELLTDSQTHWHDTFSANQRLRKSFRADRKIREANNKTKRGVQERFGLGMDLLDYSNDDKIRAAMVDFDGSSVPGNAAARPIFQTSEKSRAKADSKSRIQAAIIGNTRAAINPFRGGQKPDAEQEAPLSALQKLKRKRDDRSIDDDQPSPQNDSTASANSACVSAARMPLIDYASDTE